MFLPGKNPSTWLLTEYSIKENPLFANLFFKESVCASMVTGYNASSEVKGDPLVPFFVSLLCWIGFYFIKTRDISQKRVTGGGIHLRDLAPGQTSSEETSQRWRGMGNTVRFDWPGNRT